MAGLTATLLVGGGLSYLNVNQKGSDVFTWFSNLVSLLTLFGWGSICLSHLRMRYAWKLQGRTPSDLPWKTWTYPFAAAWGLFWCILLIIIEFYLSVWPLGADPTAEGFFANYVSVVAVLVLFVGAQIYYRGPLWNDAANIDLDRHRRHYVARGEEEGEKSGVAKYVAKVVGVVTN